MFVKVRLTRVHQSLLYLYPDPDVVEGSEAALEHAPGYFSGFIGFSERESTGVTLHLKD